MLAEHPLINGSDLGFDIYGKTLVLVDDVLYTGAPSAPLLRTLMDVGRPDKIQAGRTGGQRA